MLTPEEELELLELEEEEYQSGKSAKALTKSSYRVRDAIGDIARPLLEGGGAVAGGMIGSPMGPLGAAGGGVLGFAAGKAGADFLDRGLGRKPLLTNLPEAAREVGNNLVSGVAAEATGQAAGKLIPPLLRGFGNVGAKLGEWSTAIPEKDFYTVAKNPVSILPGTLGKAGQKFESAMSNAGISSEMTPEAIERLRNPGKYAFDTFSKLKTQGSITPQEALHGRQSLDAVYPVPNKKNGSYIRMLDEMRDTFQSVIANSSPELKAASKDYAIAKSGSKFQSLFPRTNSGKPAYFRTGAILTGLATGHPGAMFGIPAVSGVTAAGAGMTGSVARSVLRNPAAKRLLFSRTGEAASKFLPGREVVNPGNQMQQTPDGENDSSPENQIVQRSLQHSKSIPQEIRLTKEKAREFLDEANGDKELARKLARKARYSW
jgi:hypothetical protein